MKGKLLSNELSSQKKLNPYKMFIRKLNLNVYNQCFNSFSINSYKLIKFEAKKSEIK